MATKVLGNRPNRTAAYFYWTSSNTDSTCSITLYGGYNSTINGGSGYSSSLYRIELSGTGQTTKTATGNFGTMKRGDNQCISSFTWTWNKAHSSQTITIACREYDKTPSDSSYRLESTASQNFTIGVKTSYSVQYNANGGAGAPTSQTKWYNETLTLSNSKPLKDGYKFNGWAVSSENAAAGVVNYSPGDTYSSNAPLILYAVWELLYSLPTIENVSVERCKQNGTLDDDGAYALVAFDWSVYTSSDALYYGGDTYPYLNNWVDSCSVSVGEITALPTITTQHAEVIIGNGTYGPDTQYSVSISITDTQTQIQEHTTQVEAVLSAALYPLDVNADGTAVGILHPAPDNVHGVLMGGYIMAVGMAGMVQMYAGSTEPNGWLFCDGDEYLKSDYPLLYAVIGDTYGDPNKGAVAPSDSKHFRVPDLRGRMPIGVGESAADGHTAHTLAEEDGKEAYKLTGAQSGVQAHSHIYKDYDTTYSFSNGYRTTTDHSHYAYIGSTASRADNQRTTNDNTAKDATADHTNMPPYLCVNFIIATGQIE